MKMIPVIRIEHQLWVKFSLNTGLFMPEFAIMCRSSSQAIVTLQYASLPDNMEGLRTSSAAEVR